MGLREEVASFAKKIAVEIVDPVTLEAYTACRLIPLDKSPGSTELQIRPIGVGEVLRRIVGKTISWCLNSEIQQAAGPLQVSTGLKSGAEAAIHSMKKIFDEQGTDAIILVDAANAFNRLNRNVALHNMQIICPPFATILINTYRIPARLFIVSGGEITSSEGTTQGDTLAMAFYGLSTKPILELLQKQVPEVLQVWFADDATGAGKLEALKLWWDGIQKEGLRYGYFVKPSKSWIVLKDQTKLEQCQEIFKESPIQITCEGKRHLGAAVGTEQFKNEYIDEKVSKWTNNILTLSKIAQSQPHAAYAAFVHGEQHKYTYFLRTLNNISANLKPLDTAITESFLPALFGHELSENERNIVSMSLKEGGLGVKFVGAMSDSCYETSLKVTEPLSEQIRLQSSELPNGTQVAEAKHDMITKVKAAEKQRSDEIKENQTPRLKRMLEQLSEPGASSWLGVLPLESYGCRLNKSEFQDALAIRYCSSIKNLPSKCPCGATYNLTHALDCHRGGFVNARHDNIRNLECKLLSTVVHDVECEPPLQPVINKQGYKASANLKDDARLDVRARGFFRDGQNAFFDVRVTNADCASQQDKTVKSVLRKHESQKKLHYNRRVMEVEHGSFTPLVFTTTGVMSHECSLFHKLLAEKISAKRNENYSDVMRYLRVKLSFLALKSTLLCLRGSRTISVTTDTDVSSDFGLVLGDLGI